MILTARQGDTFEVLHCRLLSPIGVKGSGAARYAAAMHFYTERLMPPDMLEIYRRCSKMDHEDPVDLARYEGIAIPAISTGEPRAGTV